MQTTLQELKQNWDGVEFEKHHFLETYDKEFKKFLDKENLRILELGIDKGGSLHLWQKYFSNLSLLVGVEKYSDKIIIPLRHPLKFEIGDLGENSFYDRLTKYGSFDIIIDDASHAASDIIQSFENLFPILADGGIYCIENVSYSDGLEKFAYQLLLNANGITDCLDYPERMNLYSWWIKSLHIENQLIIIRKGLWNYEERHHQVR